MKAKKSFGQHFLNKESIAREIAESLSLRNLYNGIVEVGPGRGVLTKYLMGYEDHHLKVVEADRDMVEYLAAQYSSLVPDIIGQDFLKVNLKDYFQGQYAIIGNFPYNISSQIIFKMLENKDQVPELVGMFQKEVAERIVSKPNCKAYGILSVLVQAFYETEYLFTVGPENFSPPPKVQSAVIRLHRKKDFKNLGCDEKRLKAVVKAAFGLRRKMLRNTMKQFIKKNVIFVDKFFEKRPENLSVEEFIYLTNLTFKYPSS
jgi:16S rRNA (adenine1518-N6/adenine1519-N6)-dimethyltransferase